MKIYFTLVISKKFLKFHISIAKLEKIVVFVFTYVSESLALFYRDFSMNLFSVDSNDAMKLWSIEAMKQWSDEAMKWWSDEAMKWWSDEAMKR
jgi:hypothetical protein